MVKKRSSVLEEKEVSPRLLVSYTIKIAPKTTIPKYFWINKCDPWITKCS
jgi:hypothetical protein